MEPVLEAVSEQQAKGDSYRESAWSVSLTLSEWQWQAKEESHWESAWSMSWTHCPSGKLKGICT